MNSYFKLSDKIYDITEKYPILIDLLADNGFESLRNDTMRKTMGKSISLENALKSKHFDLVLFEQKMVDTIEAAAAADDGIGEHQASQNAAPADGIHMAGVLPCPIRLQILGNLDQWIAGQKQAVTYDLQAASMGLDNLRTEIEKADSEDDLADIYLSAGFSLFFDQQVMGKYLQNGTFSDQSGFDQMNPLFDNPEIDLKDPRGQYTIIGVVPAVFMVNTAVLGDRTFPRSWTDLLKPEFRGSLAVPMQDLDLSNAILLGIYSKFGKDGIEALGQNMHRSMHPAQMVKEGARPKQNQTPAVTVMPYFFTWMAKENGPMKAVWPEDGAIISPIFLMTKSASKEKIQHLTDFLFSEQMSRVLSADGKFPSTHPQADNGLSIDRKFLWPGWDFIYAHDISKLLAETEALFQQAAGGAL